MKLPDMNKQIGPLPLWGWIVVVVGGLGLAWFIRSRSDTPTEESEPELEDTSGVPGVGTGGGAGWVSTAPPADTETDDGKIETNAEWAQLALAFLVQKGNDAALVDQVLRKYLNSEQLSAAEAVWIALVLAKYGRPPEPLSAAPDIKDPPVVTPPKDDPKPSNPKPAPPKPKVKYYTVKPWPAKGSTLSGISDISYNDNGYRWEKIYNANRKGKKRADGTTGMISDPKVIKVGWKLVIPAK